ncbi:hypothetical protein JCM8097_008380 [Rhodosporidiobolus ruineniae]
MPDRRAVIWAAPKTPPEYTLVPMEAATQTDMIWVNGVSLRAPYSVFLTDGAIIEIGRRGDPKLSWLFRTGMSISTLLVQTRVVVSVSAPSLESSSSAAPLCEAAAPPPPTSRQPVSLASFSTPSTSRTAPGLAPASFRPWTADEEALLRRLRFEDARPMMDIASALGRSKDEVERWMDYSCPRWKKEAFAPPTATNSASPSPPVPMLFFPPPSSAASAFATPTISKRPLSPSPSTVRTEDGAGRQEMKQLRVGKDPFARWKEVRRASRAFVRGAREDWAAEQGEKV